MSSPQPAHAPVRLGILAEPAGSPEVVSQDLRDALPDRLRREESNGRSWHVELRHEHLPGGEVGDHSALIDFGAKRRREEGWDVIVCVTDLPLRDGRHPLVADLAPAERLAVVSLPAFGALRVRRRVTRLVVELILELLGSDDEGSAPPAQHAALAGRSLPGPFRLVARDGEAVDAWVLARSGRGRLLTGMVRDNRPWRLVVGLRGAIVGALAFSLFWLLSPTIWQLSSALSLWRLGLVAAGTIGAMVVWLILYHGLWQRTSQDDPVWREEVALFNASTVLTLIIGLSCAYLVLFALSLGTAAGLIDSTVLGDSLRRPPSPLDYVRLTWLATSCATFAGALGAGFDSEHAVREAAYSRRAQERRRKYQQRGTDDTA